MLDFTVDDYYMNHTYAGELWLWKYMEKHFSHSDNPRIIKQLNDEKKHSAMTRGALKKDLRKRNITHFYNDVKYSIENVIYEDLCDIDVNHLNPKNFSEFVYVVERRASFLFKMYIKYGTNEYYKKMTKRLIHDEEDHLDIHKHKHNDSSVLQHYKKCDSLVWNKIASVYANDNKSFFHNKQYWEDMFSGELRQKCSIVNLL